MKILIVSDLAPPVVGGIENYIINLSKGFIKRGHEVHWLTSRLPGTKTEEDYNGIKIHRVYIPFSKHYTFPGRQFFPFTSLIKGIKLARNMDVIHINTLVPGVLGWLIAKYSGKPSILFCHEFYGKLWNFLGQNIFEKIAYPIFEKIIALGCYDMFVCPSKYSKKTIMKYGVPEKKIKVILHGISLLKKSRRNYRKFFSLENNLVVGYLGRLSQKGTGQAKNIKGLLEAFKYVIKEVPDAKLVFGGSGFEDLKPYLKGVENSVISLGRIPDNEVKNFMEMCDIIVCPALSDGFCFLLAEASSCGVPILATNSGSHPERISNNGVLVDTDSRSIAKGIIELLKNEDIRKKIGDNGLIVTKKLKWKDSVKMHLEIYRSILK